MTPLDLKALTDAVGSVGLLGVTILALWAFYTRRIRTKAEVDEAIEAGDKRCHAVTAECVERIAYIEERRADERAARQAAEQRLSALVDSIERMTDVLQSVQNELIRSPGAHGG